MPAKGTVDHVASGTQVPVKATLSYVVPQPSRPSALIVGMPYTFNESTNNGSTWTTIGTGTTGTSGVASATTLPVASGQTVEIQLDMPRYDDRRSRPSSVRTRTSRHSATSQQCRPSNWHWNLCPY